MFGLIIGKYVVPAVSPAAAGAEAFVVDHNCYSAKVCSDCELQDGVEVCSFANILDPANSFMISIQSIVFTGDLCPPPPPPGPGPIASNGLDGEGPQPDHLTRKVSRDALEAI